MTQITAAYYINDELIGAITYEGHYECSRHFICRFCGTVFGKREVVDTRFLPPHWAAWMGVCSKCIPPHWDKHSIPGGIPFFRPEYEVYPEGVIKYQLEKELDYVDAGNK